ncbi:MAG: PqqD family peptide modification chaperone [Myxococcales bacterium]|nr:PqqD family peptide modification chaperone [Myxococcales bacterium]
MPLRVHPGVIGRRLDDCYVLIDGDGEQIYELDATGARVWELLLEGVPVAGLAARLLDEFEADAARLRADVEALVAELRDARLLVEAGSVEADAPRSPLTPSDARAPRLAQGAWLLRWCAASGDAPQLSRGDAAALDVQRRPDGSWLALAGDVHDAPRAGFLVRLLARESLAPAIEALRGAFVVLSFEAGTNTLRVWRDAIGLWPCYVVWCAEQKTLLVSSDLDVLQAQPERARGFNAALVAEFVRGRASVAQCRETFYQAIERLPGGHRLTLGRGGAAPRVERTWDLFARPLRWADDDEIATLEPTLERAVVRCIESGADSVALSGGYDSVTIALLAARARQRRAAVPLTALSLAMVGTPSDESAIQRGVAEALGMPFRVFELPALERCDDFCQRALAHSARSPVPILSMWQWAFDALLAGATDGRRVMMGTGGDEMFIVDARYAEDLLRAGDLRRLLPFVRAWLATSPLPTRRVLAELLWRAGARPLLADTLGPQLTRLLRSVLAFGRSVSPAPPALSTRPVTELLEARAAREARRDGSAYVAALRELVHGPTLMLELDQSGAWSARHGRRLCYPFFDRDLVELALRLPPEHLYRRGQMKSPLRELVARELPALPPTQRKVDFTALGCELVRRTGAAVWQALGGAPALAALGVVEREEAEAWMRAYFAGQVERPAQAWRLLSTEHWLQQRTD